MRIAYLCSSLSLGGLELNQLKNATWMKNRGHHVYVLGVKDSPFYEQAKTLGLKTLEIRRHRKYYDFLGALALNALVKKYNIEKMFVRDTRDISIMATLKCLRRTKITTAYFMEMQLGVKKTNFLHTLRFSFLDFWFCPLPYLVDQVKSWTHVNPAKIFLVPSGIDTQGLEKIPASEARKHLQLESGVFYFGLIGRFDLQKGQLLLLEAITHAKRSDFKVVFLGEPTKNENNGVHEQMLTFIEKNHLTERVEIRPFMKDVGIFYCAINCLVMATKAETFGMVSLEAIAHGIPVIGSHLGGTPDLLHNEQFGRCFQSMNAHDLALKLDAMVGENFQINPEEKDAFIGQFDQEKVCIAIENTLSP